MLLLLLVMQLGNPWHLTHLLQWWHIKSCKPFLGVMIPGLCLHPARNKEGKQ